MTGDVVIISGPTAVGKGTLVRELIKRYPEIFLSVSVTTRAPRPGEVDGIHYYFIDDARFDELLESAGLLEWASVHGHTRYGTPRAQVEQAINAGRTVILEIDLQGARQVKQHWPTAKLIFIAPPDDDALLQRLQHRGTETPAQIKRRLETAKLEMAAVNEFDYVVVNDDLGQVVNELVDLIGL